MDSLVNSRPLIMSSQPILQNLDDETRFQGRIFVEIWDKSDHAYFGVPFTYKDQALKALYAPISGMVIDQTYLASLGSPVLGVIPDEAFLGTAILDVWDGQIIAAFTGPREQLLPRAAEVLGRPYKEIHWDR